MINYYKKCINSKFNKKIMSESRKEGLRVVAHNEITIQVPRYLRFILDEMDLKLNEILNNTDLVIWMYWSDWRIEKINTGKEWIELIWYTNDKSLLEIREEIVDALKELAEEGVKHFFSVMEEEWESWKEEWKTSTEVSWWDIENGVTIESNSSQSISDYMKAMNVVERLKPESLDLKYIGDQRLYTGQRGWGRSWLDYYPDSVLDSEFLFWDLSTLIKAKTTMMKLIMNDKSIVKGYYDTIKPYFKERSVVGGHNEHWSKKKNNRHHHKLWENMIYFDHENKLFWFKHWPIRAIQYMISYWFFCSLSKIDGWLDKWPDFIEYATSLTAHDRIQKRIELVKKSWIFKNFDNLDFKRLKDIYDFFRDWQNATEPLVEWYDWLEKEWMLNIIEIFVKVIKSIESIGRDENKILCMKLLPSFAKEAERKLIQLQALVKKAELPSISS